MSWAAKSLPEAGPSTDEEGAKMEVDAARTAARRKRLTGTSIPERRPAPATLHLDECCATGFYFCKGCYRCMAPSVQLASNLECDRCGRKHGIQWCPPVPGFPATKRREAV